MSIPEIIAGLLKNDKGVKKYLFETYYGKLMGIVLRYSKSQYQANEIYSEIFYNCLYALQQQKPNQLTDLDTFLQKEVIRQSIAAIKNIRSEYYMASTVYATNKDHKNYDLFEGAELIDYLGVDGDTLLKSLQLLVPSQRLIFNLHVVDGHSLEEASLMLEASEETVKSNLEKARFNLQKNIEKCLKKAKYEQSF
jgi:RNA polymerase sigma-70 factor, ECF subfamily